MQKYYDVFHRTWWHWENGKRVPGVGRRFYLSRDVTYTQARAICRRWNNLHEPGELSDKAEFEESEG